MARNSDANLDALIARLVKATAGRGKRTALAKFLRVPFPRLSEWLNKAAAPGGETTLKLLAWVQAEEAKKMKAPDDVTTTIRSKTRSKDATYEETRKRANPRQS